MKEKPEDSDDRLANCRLRVRQYLSCFLIIINDYLNYRLMYQLTIKNYFSIIPLNLLLRGKILVFSIIQVIIQVVLPLPHLLAVKQSAHHDPLMLSPYLYLFLEANLKNNPTLSSPSLSFRSFSFFYPPKSASNSSYLFY